MIKESTLIPICAAFLCSCVSDSHTKLKYQRGQVYQTIVPIVVEPDERSAIVFAFHDSHLTENQIKLRKRYGDNFRRETVRPGLRFRIEDVTFVALDSAWGRNEAVAAKLINGEYAGYVISVEKISHQTHSPLGVTKWYPDTAIVKLVRR